MNEGLHGRGAAIKLIYQTVRATARTWITRADPFFCWNSRPGPAWHGHYEPAG